MQHGPVSMKNRRTWARAEFDRLRHERTKRGKWRPDRKVALVTDDETRAFIVAARLEERVPFDRASFGYRVLQGAEDIANLDPGDPGYTATLQRVRERCELEFRTTDLFGYAKKLLASFDTNENAVIVLESPTADDLMVRGFIKSTWGDGGAKRAEEKLGMERSLVEKHSRFAARIRECGYVHPIAHLGIPVGVGLAAALTTSSAGAASSVSSLAAVAGKIAGGVAALVVILGTFRSCARDAPPNLADTRSLAHDDDRVSETNRPIVTHSPDRVSPRRRDEVDVSDNGTKPVARTRFSERNQPRKERSNVVAVLISSLFGDEADSEDDGPLEVRCERGAFGCLVDNERCEPNGLFVEGQPREPGPDSLYCKCPKPGPVRARGSWLRPEDSCDGLYD